MALQLARFAVCCATEFSRLARFALKNSGGQKAASEPSRTNTQMKT